MQSSVEIKVLSAININIKCALLKFDAHEERTCELPVKLVVEHEGQYLVTSRLTERTNQQPEKHIAHVVQAADTLMLLGLQKGQPIF